MTKPLFKYIGGKTWLKNDLLKQVSEILTINPFITTYCEPFVGGLGSFLSVVNVLQQYKIRNIYLSDINPSLIFSYIFIQEEPDEFFKHIQKYELKFKESVPLEWKNNDKNITKNKLLNASLYFNEIRQQYNIEKKVPSIDTCAKFIFLQKHCFNGIYRENSKGDYNTPFNWSGKSFENDIFQNLMELHKIFNQFHISFSIQSFETVDYNQNTLYYLDPPYINEIIVENKYHQDSFGINQQLLLIEKISKSPFLYSNHEHQSLLNEFNQLNNILINRFYRKNIISSNPNNRNQDKAEILISHWI